MQDPVSQDLQGISPGSHIQSLLLPVYPGVVHIPGMPLTSYRQTDNSENRSAPAQPILSLLLTQTNV